MSFANHINHVLGRDPDCESLLPIDPESEQLFSAVSNGVLLAKLINDSAPNTIDERVLVKKVNMNRFEMLQNLNLVINSAKGVGCKITNIRPEDITEGKPHLILGLVWQVVKVGVFLAFSWGVFDLWLHHTPDATLPHGCCHNLLVQVGLVADINLQAHPELVRLLREGEEMADLLKLSPEELLIRWVNYHLQQGGSDRRISNFSGDIKDSVVYTVSILPFRISHRRSWSCCFAKRTCWTLSVLKVPLPLCLPRSCCIRSLMARAARMLWQSKMSVLVPKQYWRMLTLWTAASSCLRMTLSRYCGSVADDAPSFCLCCRCFTGMDLCSDACVYVLAWRGAYLDCSLGHGVFCVCGDVGVLWCMVWFVYATFFFNIGFL